MEKMETIEALTRHYHEILGQAEKGRFGKSKLIAERKELEQEIFSRSASTTAELNEKARLLLGLLEDRGSAYHSAEEKEEFFINLLHDVLKLYRDEKLSPSGSYGPEAAMGYYHWMFSG